MVKYDAKVIEIRDETPRVRSFKVWWQGIEQFTFKPGQFMMLSVPGFLNPGGFPVKRAYSIANAPIEKGFLEFTVTAKNPNGLSAQLNKLKVGDMISCEGPAGMFGLKLPAKKNITFISSGSGISSLRCMYRQLLLEGFKEDIWLVAGFHAPTDYIYKDELMHLRVKHPHFHVIPAITTDDSNWDGERGRVTAILPKLFKDAPSREYYLCGSLQMVDDTIKVLTDMGVPRGQIHREIW